MRKLNNRTRYFHVQQRTVESTPAWDPFNPSKVPVRSTWRRLEFKWRQRRCPPAAASWPPPVPPRRMRECTCLACAPPPLPRRSQSTCVPRWLLCMPPAKSAAAKARKPREPSPRGRHPGAERLADSVKQPPRAVCARVLLADAELRWQVCLNEDRQVDG